MPEKPKKIQRSWVPQRKAFERSKDNSSFYNSWPWRKKRKSFLESNPLCVICEAKGEVVRATVVDHKIPINAGGAPLDDDNLQSMCESCHNSKSSSESRGYGVKSHGAK